MRSRKRRLQTRSALQGRFSGRQLACRFSSRPLSMLEIGTETSGSIISPSSAEGIIGLRPTVGLVPGYGIAPISASQDTAGPMVRTVADAAMTLQSIAGADPQSNVEYTNVFGPD